MPNRHSWMGGMWRSCWNGGWRRAILFRRPHGVCIWTLFFVFRSCLGIILRIRAYSSRITRLLLPQLFPPPYHAPARRAGDDEAISRCMDLARRTAYDPAVLVTAAAFGSPS